MTVNMQTSSSLVSTLTMTEPHSLDVFDGPGLLERVHAVATSIANIAPLAVRAAKTMVLTNPDLSLQASNKLEKQIFSSLFGTADQKEGMSAFLEKGAPKFVGA